MTWLLLRTPSGTAVEHHALLGAALAVAICGVTGSAMTATTFHGDPLPPPCCPNCDARKAEAVALKTRARLLEESILVDEPREVVAFHALLLLQMMRARGMA